MATRGPWVQFHISGIAPFTWLDKSMILQVDKEEIRSLQIELEYAQEALKIILGERPVKPQRLNCLRATCDAIKENTCDRLQNVSSDCFQKPTEQSNSEHWMKWMITRCLGPEYTILVEASFFSSKNYAIHQRVQVIWYLFENRCEFICESLLQHAAERQLPYATNSRLVAAFADLPTRFQDLIRLIVFMGDDIHARVLLSATNARNWGPDGEVMGSRLPLIEALRSPDSLNYSLNQLLASAVIRCRTDDREYYCVPLQLATYIREATLFPHKWKMEAAKTVISGFPKEAQLEPINFTANGRLMLPLLRQVLISLQRSGNIEPILADESIEACLSASQFGSQESKIFFIQTAESFLPFASSQEYWARIIIRKKGLSRLFPEFENSDIPFENLLNVIDRTTHRSNAYFGKGVLMQAHYMIDREDPEDKVLSMLNTFRPLNSEHVSTQEKLVNVEKRFRTAQCFRFRGNFSAAEEHSTIAYQDAQSLNARFLWRIQPFYGEVLCEVHCPDLAITVLKGFLLQPKQLGTEGSHSVRRSELALANAFLMKALLQATETLWIRDEEGLLEQAKDYYEITLNAYTSETSQIGRMNYFASCAGIALINHIQHGGSEAYLAWGTAQQAARKCWREPGYSEMLCLYARSQIARNANLVEAGALRQQMEAIRPRIKNQFRHYFCGHGTAFPDTICRLEQGEPFFSQNLN